MATHNKRLSVIFLIAASILLLPLLAMQFTKEVNWTLSDFIVAGLLLFGIGLVIEFVLRKIRKANIRNIIIASIIVVFLLIWAELAVGLFGTPLAGS